jgi:Ca2+-dependent lipid-binding protein
MEKYVFTIKIIEAEDLKACDINGLSDPYVVIGDEFQKRLAKTRVVYSNLNPRWDETFDIVTQGPLNIVATIWDWDTLGDHDCVGRTSLKLDPSHFRDFLPREYWMDLDTQGRLLLRVSMEGERDDIQFYFGKAFRSLKRTEKEMTRTITDKVIRQLIGFSGDTNFYSCRRTFDMFSRDSDYVVSYLEEVYQYKVHSAISTATGLPQLEASH